VLGCILFVMSTLKQIPNNLYRVVRQ